MRRPGGATLPEILLAGTLLLVVTGVSYATLLLVNRSTVAASARAASLVNAEVAVERLRREMQESTPESILVAPGKVAFATARDADGIFRTDDEGRPVFGAFVVYYVSAEGDLRRRRLAGLQTLTMEGLESACDGSGRLVAHGVQDLAVEQDGDQIELGVACQTEANGRVNRLRLDAEFTVRN